MSNTDNEEVGDRLKENSQNLDCGLWHWMGDLPLPPELVERVT